eukprot:TRINITY_DN68027_c11_g4_i1.p2 TRINITY_DN68027_c11_g4~~TRINITY_DN68027_c11_g4_i1.p2  ORF type:complete len:112 (+),score=3.96 TRINITY_DN68027_c11_g4_i1:325-660(+)
MTRETDRLRAGGSIIPVDMQQSGHVCLLPKRVQARMDELFKAGAISRSDVDQHCLTTLARCSELDGCDIVDEWLVRLEHNHTIRNVSAWMTRHIGNHTKRLSGRLPPLGGR